MGNQNSTLAEGTANSFMALLQVSHNNAQDDCPDQECPSHTRRKRDRNYGINELDYMTEAKFKRMFRMSRRAFNALLEKIQPFMPVIDTDKAVNSAGSEINNLIKLACTLRWLAGGSHHDVCTLFGVSDAAMFSCNRYGIIWPTMIAIDQALDMIINRQLVCMVCAKLHNFCVDMCERQIYAREQSDIEDGDEPILVMNEDDLFDQVQHELNQNVRNSAGGNRRTNITAALEHEGARRPIWAYSGKSAAAT